MKNFIDLIKEINRTLNEIILFETLVHTILLFLVVYLVLSVFNLYPISALVPAVVYFFIAGNVRMRKNKVRMVEGFCIYNFIFHNSFYFLIQCASY